VPNDLINTDPIIAQNFYLSLDGTDILLTSVSGLDMEVDVSEIHQTGKARVKTRGVNTKVPDFSVSRMAPMDAVNDPIWKWFREIRAGGFAGTDRATNRKNGSIIFFDTAKTEVGRYNFERAWVTKISTDQVTTDSSDPLKETITIVCEVLDRVK
jgi:phage tail-like protein